MMTNTLSLPMRERVMPHCQEDRERIVDVPVWVDPGGHTRARQGLADSTSVRCPDFAFVFLLSWIVFRSLSSGSAEEGASVVAAFTLSWGLSLSFDGVVESVPTRQAQESQRPTISRTRWTNHRSLSFIGGAFGGVSSITVALVPGN